MGLHVHNGPNLGNNISMLNLKACALDPEGLEHPSVVHP